MCSRDDSGGRDISMKLTKQRKRLAVDNQDGFTLVEVLVAIVIMVIIATAGASLTFNGIATSATEERAQVAVTIANGAMENVSSYSAALNAASGVSALYNGRSKTAVTNAFGGVNANMPGVAQTIPVWDINAAATANGTIPIVTPDPATSAPATPQNGTKYTVTTLIGACYQQATIQSATKSDGSANPNDCTAVKGSVPTPLIRAIVIVRWTAGNKCNTVAGCTYETSTLLDPNSDIEWVTPHS
jgi:prepilin-type N-terminal cleavage/methylation domain-containing protein